MSGTTWSPAGPLAAFAAGGAWPPRLWVAVGVAVAMHAALLALRPSGASGRHVAPAVRAMAVRMVEPVADPIAPTAARAPVAEPTPVAVASPAAAADASALPTPARSAKAARGRATGPDGVATARPEPAPRAPAPAAMPSDTQAALPAAPDYALGIRLDPGPRPLDEIDPDYPDPNMREGTVVLRLLISEKGQVDNVAVVRSEPRGVFDQAALDAFGKARFSPGLAAGTPVKSQIMVEVHFAPINRGSRVSGRTY